MADVTIRPFEVHVPEEDLADLQRRIAATRSGAAVPAGYGFSAEPDSVGWDPGRVAQGWA